MKPIVAIVGRPNVGKSTLFNRLAGKRSSIVRDTPGVTRDRLYAECEWSGRNFTIIDTGGIEPKTDDKILQYMRDQALAAIHIADVVIFVTDAQTGLTDADGEVGRMLRKAKANCLLAVNKLDNLSSETALSAMYEFYELGLGDPHPISAESGGGVADLLDEVLTMLPQEEPEENAEEALCVAIIGKPNAGKSSLLNRLVGEERVIVSDIAGTTRDSVDTYITHNDKKYCFIDTAGIRRQSKIHEAIEHFSVMHAVTSVERADVVLVLIDATEGVTEQDAKIAGLAHDNGKACIICVNKWDAIEKDDKTMQKFEQNVRNTLSYMPYAEMVFISAKTGQRVERIYELIDKVHENHNRRIGTGVLNDLLYEAMTMQQPPSDKGKPLKVYYMTQVSVAPPTFVCFVNETELMHYSYKRYIENRLRDAIDFSGTPIRILVREKNEKE